MEPSLRLKKSTTETTTLDTTFCVHTFALSFTLSVLTGYPANFRNNVVAFPSANSERSCSLLFATMLSTVRSETPDQPRQKLSRT